MKATLAALLISLIGPISLIPATVQAQDLEAPAEAERLLGLKTEDGSHLMFADIGSVFDTDAVGRAAWWAKPFAVLAESGKALARVPGAYIENVKADPVETTIGTIAGALLVADLAGVDVMQEIEDAVDPDESTRKKRSNSVSVSKDGTFEAEAPEDAQIELEYSASANGGLSITFSSDRRSK